MSTNSIYIYIYTLSIVIYNISYINSPFRSCKCSDKTRVFGKISSCNTIGYLICPFKTNCRVFLWISVSLPSDECCGFSFIISQRLLTTWHTVNSDLRHYISFLDHDLFSRIRVVQPYSDIFGHRPQCQSAKITWCLCSFNSLAPCDILFMPPTVNIKHAMTSLTFMIYALTYCHIYIHIYIYIFTDIYISVISHGTQPVCALFSYQYTTLYWGAFSSYSDWINFNHNP